MMQPTGNLAAAVAGRYAIERELGRGGTATVWLAEDLRHSRPVAIKLLQPELAAMLGTDRFLVEIQIAARLSHPHIVPLFDSGEADGIPYYVMPFVAGESLRGALDRERRMSVENTIQIGREIGGALAFAHDQGVVHRDIKPENILLAAGHALITDFGVARAIDVSSNERLTMLGIAVGTPAYVSPEQAAGDPDVDSRSDIYSLGCVLYEMLSGQPPFTGPTANAIIAKRFVERPAPLGDMRRDIPATLAAAVERSMERDPALRFATAGEFVSALSSRPGTISDSALYAYRHEGAAREHTVAVLPFTNMSADQESEYFADGMTEELINALSNVPSLRVPARTSSFAFKRTKEDVRAVGQKLGVASVLEGSIRRAGDRLRVTAQLIDVTNGFHLWSEKYDRDMKDVFAIQDEISAAIVTTVRAKLVAGEVSGRAAAGSLARQGTADLDAYHLYLKGRYHWYQRDLSRAVSYFEQAIAKDPNYALAHCGLADTYSALGLFGIVPSGVAYERARSLVVRALASDDSLAEAHYSRGLIEFYFGWDFREAIRGFRQAIEINPRLAAAHASLCAVAGMVGDKVTALDAGPRAQELEPLSPLISATASMGYYLMGRFELTEVACQQAVAVDPAQNTAGYLLGLSWAAQGRFDEAIPRLEATAQRMQRLPHILMFLGEVLWAAGRETEARGILAELYERGATGVDRPAAKAWLHLHFGELDKGFELLEIAAGQRDPAVPFLLGWPGIDNVRADARYDGIVERLGLSEYSAVWKARSVLISPAK